MMETSQLNFRKEELEMLNSLTSLNYVKFLHDVKEYLPEKFLLYKASRIYEEELILLLCPKTYDKGNYCPKKLLEIYVKLAHVNLLASDYARALSAYQKALEENEEEFYKDDSALYGLGLCYFHFRAYRPAIEAFCQLLFCHPFTEVATEAYARLGIAYKCCENFSQALKHLLIALDNSNESPLLPKYQIRFHIAHCYDASGDFRRGVEEYRRLLSDHERGLFQLPVELLAAVFRQLGWINLRARETEFKEEVRFQKLKEAEQLLCRARELVGTDSKTNCYLGVCYSAQTATLPSAPASASGPNAQSPAAAATNSTRSFAADRAQDAFVSYRSSIDSDESDANVWCSIGILYQQQNQPLDALQSFACAVQLDEKHSGAWTELGRLYESHRQFQEALNCFKKALLYNSAAPESLKTRISVYEKECSSPNFLNILNSGNLQLVQQRSAALNPNNPASVSSVKPIQLLPSLENAWKLGIPAQVRQRLADINKTQKNRYREGSFLWNMSELAAHSMRQPFYELDPTQRQIMQVLKLNKEQLEQNELKLLKQLEERYNSIVNSSSTGIPVDSYKLKVESSKPSTSTSTSAEEKSIKVEEGSVNTTTAMSNTGLPCISQDDLEDVLGDSVKPQKPSSSVVSSSSTSATPKRPHSTEKSTEPTDTPSGSPAARKAAKLKRKLVKIEAEGENPDEGAIDEANISTSSLTSRRGSRRSSPLSSLKQSNYMLLQRQHLPPAFSLLAPVHVPVTVTSAEIMELCKLRRTNPDEYQPIFDEHFPPPKPPVVPTNNGKLSKEKLLLKTPLIVVENAKEASTTELMNFCYNSPIALVHGLTAALKIDLSQFSTKSLIQTAPDHEVEVRTQFKMPTDTNVDQLGNSTWCCYSARSFTTINRYGQYQAESFRHSLKEETEKLRQVGAVAGGSALPTGNSVLGTASGTIGPSGSSTTPGTSIKTETDSALLSSAKKKRLLGGLNSSQSNLSGGANEDLINGTNGTNGAGPAPGTSKMIKFGTNVDLSDEKKFHAQLRELNKMPAFCRISAGCNLLTYLGHTVLGMNTVQLYMKVPGCRTPGHLENNSFASININIGPGECEWFGVPYEYWPVVEKMCKERNLDFLKGAWWPSFQDLIRADVPCYRFTQKAGDMVWVGGGCVHWVQATGWCNNVAWNVGPMTANQIEMALYAHEWNRLNSYRSLVPMQHLCWQLAQKVRFSNQKIFNTVKNLMVRSLAYCRMVADFVESTSKSPIKIQRRMEGEVAHYCHLCEIEVFNLLFVKEISGKFRVFCVQCASKNPIDDYVVLQQIPFEELNAIFDRLQLYPAKSALVC